MRRTEDWFVHDFPCSGNAIADARGRFERWLSSQPVDEEVRDELAIVMSELGANAVTAAAAEADGRIAARAWRQGVEVVLEVENVPDGNSHPIVVHDGGDPLRGSGRGLVIVAAYTDDMEVIPPDRGRGLIVRCRRRV